MSAEGLTNIGLKRNKNQDTFLIREDFNLYVVADGMGGHQAGEVASAIATRTIERVFSEASRKDFSVVQVLKSAVEEANSIIYQSSKNNSQDYIMGTTLTTAAIEGNTAYIAHVGDSRAYIMDEKTITPITVDHSYVGELIRNGSLSEEEAVSHPQRNILTRALGTEPHVNIDLFEIQMKKNDCLILCTDGLFNALSKEEIHEIVLAAADLRQATKKLIDEALLKDGNDNITVVLFKND